MKKLLITGFAVLSVGSLGMAAYFHFKKKQLWNPQPVKVSEPSEEEPVSQNIEMPEDEKPVSYISSGIASTISQTQPAKEAIPNQTTVTPITPEPKTIQSTLPTAKDLSTATVQNSGIATPAIKSAVATTKPVVKAPAATAKPKPLASTPKPVIRAKTITKPSTTRISKPIQKAATVKRLSGDGWLEAAGDDMEQRFFSTL